MILLASRKQSGIWAASYCRTGFTLIELLVVVAIIAILAAIAVPNFLEAQTRSKTSRTLSDMAVVAAGIDMYYADTRSYPQNHLEVTDLLNQCARGPEMNVNNIATPEYARYSWSHSDKQIGVRSGNHELPFRTNSNYWYNSDYSPIVMRAAWDLAILTTPVPYCGASLPRDSFTPGTSFVYFNLLDVDAAGTASLSGELGRQRWVLISPGPDTSLQRPYFNPICGSWKDYDPTNGTVSKGDILRFGKHTPTAINVVGTSETAFGASVWGDVPI
jgi:prepilin-type N-terminal cleavage/methylation domain-containing protein